jgi:anti-anti-sigma factor
MSASRPRHLRCPLIVLSITSSQLSGDQIADQVRDELLDLLERFGAVHVVLDLKAVTYISSAGIRPLLSLVKAVREREGRLVLANVSPQVKEVLSVTRLLTSGGITPTTLEAQPDVPAAVASLYHGHA